jgi:glycerol-3-phosphate dehydrogenase
MPIAEQINRIIYHGAPPRDAVAALMNRSIKAETQ